MSSLHLLVIGDITASHMKPLEGLPPGIVMTAGISAEDLRAAAPDADAVLVTTGRGDVLAELWPAMPKLRWVHSIAAGVEAVLVPCLRDSDIPLTNSRGVFKESLGEFVVAAILYFAKNLRRMVRNQEAARWEQFDVDMLNRQSVGVVGYGEIGQAAAQRAHALGMKVSAIRRRPELSSDDPILSRTYSIEDRVQMMGDVDYVIAAAPLTPDTRDLIGPREIAAMKPTGVLINVGRGPVISEAALVEALSQRRIRGAALDVFDTEPLPAGHPFWGFDNLLISPHCADHIDGWLEDAVRFFVGNVELFAAGKPLRNIVDKKAGY